MGIFLNILVAYSFHYQLVLEKYSNANLEDFLVINGLANIPTIVYLTLFIYFAFSSKVKQTFVIGNEQSDTGTTKTKNKSMYGLFHDADSNAIDNSILSAKEHTGGNGGIKLGGFLYP